MWSVEIASYLFYQYLVGRQEHLRKRFLTEKSLKIFVDSKHIIMLKYTSRIKHNFGFEIITWNFYIIQAAKNFITNKSKIFTLFWIIIIS